MRFTGYNSVLLPQVDSFSFSITGIRVPNTGLAKFSFVDTGSSRLDFVFSGGYIIFDKVIGTYNPVDESSIDGYVSSGFINYKVNGIFAEKSIIFNSLNKAEVSGDNSIIYGDVKVNSNPFNYSLQFAPNYNCFDSLTGLAISEVGFSVNSPSFIFFNTNKDLLSNNYPTGFFIPKTGVALSFQDIDDSFTEYPNNFNISLNSTFGDIGGKFSPSRIGVSNKTILSLSDSQQNIYYKTSLFDGTWSGNSFSYLDNPTSYNLNFNYGFYDYVGQGYSSKITVVFKPLTLVQNGTYPAEYVTGFHLTSGGSYSYPPELSFSEYYFVTGLRRSLESFLLSSGCSNQIAVSFSGGNPSIPASGALILKSVQIGRAHV